MAGMIRRCLGMGGSKGFYPTLIILGLLAVAAMLVKSAPAPGTQSARRAAQPPATVHPAPPADANELGQVPSWSTI